jgi:hypothetical protein
MFLIRRSSRSLLVVAHVHHDELSQSVSQALKRGGRLRGSQRRLDVGLRCLSAVCAHLALDPSVVGGSIRILAKKLRVRGRYGL